MLGDMLSKQQQDKEAELKKLQAQHDAQMARWSESNQDTETRVKSLQDEVRFCCYNIRKRLSTIHSEDLFVPDWLGA